MVDKPHALAYQSALKVLQDVPILHSCTHSCRDKQTSMHGHQSTLRFKSAWSTFNLHKALCLLIRYGCHTCFENSVFQSTMMTSHLCLEPSFPTLLKLKAKVKCHHGILKRTVFTNKHVWQPYLRGTALSPPFWVRSASCGFEPPTVEPQIKGYRYGSSANFQTQMWEVPLAVRALPRAWGFLKNCGACGHCTSGRMISHVRDVYL